MEENLRIFFGPQERSKGAELVRKDLVSISSSTETDVRGFVKGATACRVALTADEVDGPTFSSTCTCPQARKGNLCRHMWAVLLKLEESGADFLNGKVEALAPVAKTDPATETRLAKQNEFKEQQRVRAKERNKEIRERKKREEHGPHVQYPAPVQESLAFFSANGFPLDDFEMAALVNARKLLSRVFHPDRGGSHEEVLELNAHFEVLESYLNT